MKRRKNELVGRQLDVIEKTLSTEVITLFIADAERKSLREFTINYYRQECNDFRKFLVTNDYSLIVNEVVREQIDEFVDDLKKRPNLKPTMINPRLRALRTLFNFLEDCKYIFDNPMRKYPLLKDRKWVTYH
ncbi:site-specific integrase [Paraliobacillus ryukyuensis]|uniref:site-specific integrase n=1 Tax=Paraliobacillus ryukyuensis TaxID=200904 RepID=UPI0015C43C2E|nr:phage integrase N-terminal SAM-like domain-containing protein [Paraliobacillus ryukyuensis]